MTAPRRIALLLAAIATVCAVAGVMLPRAEFGHAAGINVASSKVSVFKPSGLPPVCTSQTITASADTYVNEQQNTTNYGGLGTMNVVSRNGRTARTLVQFTLPAAPTGCTLSSATLRLNNTTTTTTRRVAVARADRTWTELGVTWSTPAPQPTGTAVDVAASSGWMQWTVTPQVQTLYSGSNFGFILYDTNEVGTTAFTQQFDSRTGTNKPELVLQWG